MSLFPEMEKPPAGEAEPAGSGAKPAARKAPVPRPATPGGYLALARKYRPGAFDEVVGQEAVISTLRNAIEGGRLHHAYLFSGIRGVGKTTVARLFARALNCVKGPTPAPCGACDPCREIAAGTSMDVIELDAASNRGVDDVEPLREAARYAPSRDRNKVFILDEAHMLSNAAFNSLLKILEEPPPRIVWILATTEYRKIPPTVVSRCQHFEFHRVPRAVVAGYLRGIAAAEKAEVSDEGLEVIAATAGGSVRDAVSLLDQAIAYSGASVSAEDVRRAIGVIDRRLLFGFLRLIAQRDAAGVLELIATLADGGADFSQFASGLLSTIRDAAVVRFSPEAERVVAATGEEAAELRDLAAAFDEDGLLRVFNAILDLPGALRGAPQPRFVLEAAALRLTRLADLTPIEEVIRELKDGGGAPPAGPGAGTAGTPGGQSSLRGGGAPRGRSASAPREATPSSQPRSAEPAAAAAPSSGREPATAAPGAAAGDPGTRERFISAVQARKISLRTFLESAREIQALGDRIRVVFAPQQNFFRQGISTPESLEILRAAAEEAAGRPLEIEIASGDGGNGAPPPAAAPSGGPGRREQLIQQAMSRPGVKMLIDTFGGQIVDIRELG